MTSARSTQALEQASALLECVNYFSGGFNESAQERAERTRLFEVPGACPPYEAAWIRRDKGAIIGDICGFYNAFGFEIDASAGIRADHIAAELEYLSVLRIMEARALDAGEIEKADVALEAYLNFLGDHLGDWIVPFCRRLEACTESIPMNEVCGHLKRFWDEAASAHGLTEFAQLEASTPEAAFEPIGDEGTPYECLGQSNGCDDSTSAGMVELTTSAPARDDSAISN